MILIHRRHGMKKPAPCIGFTALCMICTWALSSCQVGSRTINSQTSINVDVYDCASEADGCIITLGRGYGVANPDLEPYKESVVTVNGMDVPYFTTWTTCAEFTTWGLDLNPGDAVSVVIENPSLSTIRIDGTVPPEVTDGWLVGDVNAYMTGTLSTIRMEWTPVGSSNYDAMISLSDSDGLTFSSAGQIIDDSYLILGQDNLWDYGHTKKGSFIELQVSAVNIYDIPGCMQYSSLSVHSENCPVYP